MRREGCFMVNEFTMDNSAGINTNSAERVHSAEANQQRWMNLLATDPHAVTLTLLVFALYVFTVHFFTVISSERIYSCPANFFQVQSEPAPPRQSLPSTTSNVVFCPPHEHHHR